MIARKNFLCLAVVLFCSIGALAQNEEENPCLNDKTTADNGSNAGVRMCFTELQHKMAKEIDLLVAQQVKELYAAARKSLSEVHTPNETCSENHLDIESAKLFRRSARALELSQIRWRVYREGYCRAVESEWTIGSGAPGAYQECMYDLALQRKKELLRDFGSPSDAK
ncbi:MAG: lysozyme inhibitor LprI family protein [Terracidiphilus sp.]